MGKDEGRLTISKTNAVEDYITVSIRMSDRTIRVQVSMREYARAAFGVAEVPCFVDTRIGKFYGTNTKK